MCNLFGSRMSWSELVEAFGEAGLPIVSPPAHAAPNLPERPEIRFTDPAPVVRAAEGGAALLEARWGLKGSRAPVTNFRSEGRRFEPESRCLIPLSEFYEFTGAKSPKTRWRFTAADGRWPAFAGLWKADEEVGGRFTLLTTAPGPDVAPIHDRQPVVLARERWADWLRGGDEAALLGPSPTGMLHVEWAGGPQPPML
jgi:putative SOS response-associated peptidase YedK